VVYTTKSPETVKEFAFCARVRGEEDDVAENKVPEHVRPRKRDVAGEVEDWEMSITRTTSQALPKSTHGMSRLESISSSRVSGHRYQLDRVLAYIQTPCHYDGELRLHMYELGAIPMIQDLEPLEP
jgi:hypothetical protein